MLRTFEQGGVGTRRGLWVAIAAAATLLLVATVAGADEIRLRREVASQGPSVKLHEVAELSGPRAEALADTAVLLFTEGQAEGRVTLDGLRAVLDSAGTNWGVVSLRGFASCKVHRTVGGLAGTASRPEPGSDSIAAMPVPADARDAATNPGQPLDIEAALSLKALVLDHLAQQAAAAPQDLRIAFSERDEAQLARSALRDRFEIEPVGRNTLGRVPLTIRRYRGSEVAETLRVTADIARRSLAVVATATISRGTLFTRDSIEVQELWVTDARSQPVADPKLVIGQTSKVLLRPGTAVLSEHLEQPVLVQRGELITVRCIVGGLVIRTVGRASEAGAFDQMIQVRNEVTRETFVATVTGPREAVVRLDEAAAAAATTTPNAVPGAE